MADPDEDLIEADSEDEDDAEISPTDEDAEIIEDDEEEPPAPRRNDPPPGPRYTNLLRLKIGDRIFSNQEGDFIGQARLVKSDTAHHWLKAVLYDPDASILASLNDDMDVEIEIGFLDGERRNVMVGFFHEFGRLPPDGTHIVVKDVSAALADTQAAVATAENATEEDEDSEEDEDTEGEEADEDEDSDGNEGDEDEDEVTPVETEETVETERPKNRRSGLGSLGRLLDRLDEVSRINREGRERLNPIDLLPERFGVANAMLQFRSDTNYADDSAGLVNLAETLIQSVSRQAALRGETVIVQGNEVVEVQPGSEVSTDIHFNWDNDRDCFISTPCCKHITNKGRGTIRVVGYDTSGHQQVTAIVNTPGGQSASPATGTINAPGIGDIKLDDPIYEGCSYTWADATKDGTRMPEDQSVVQHIVNVAQELQKITVEFNSGSRVEVTSWYRPPAANAAAGGSSRSRHMTGDAVDMYFPNMDAMYAKYNSDHPGGVAIAHGSFIHVDMRHLDGGGADRWNY